MIMVHKTEFALIMALEEMGIEYEAIMLGVGDVVISERTVIEIKRANWDNKFGVWRHDFISSIIDQREFYQSENMRYNFDRCITIIEDWDNLIKDRRIGYKAVASTMAIASAKNGISFIPSRNQEETIDIILKCIEVDKDDGYFVPVNKHPKPKSLYHSQIYFLSGMLNVGRKNAIRLLDELMNPFNVMQEIMYSEIKAPKKGKKLKLFGTFTKIKGFGLKFVKSNKDLLKTNIEDSKLIFSKEVN